MEKINSKKLDIRLELLGKRQKYSKKLIKIMFLLLRMENCFESYVLTRSIRYRK